MKKRMTALLLALTLILALGAPSALAEGDASKKAAAQARSVGMVLDTGNTEPTGTDTQQAPENAAAQQTAGDPAQPQQDAGTSDAQPNEETAELGEEDTEPLDPEGTLTFGNLQARMMTGSYSMRALQESIDDIENHDYDWQYDYLRTYMNEITATLRMPPETASMQTLSTLSTVFEQLRKEYKDIEEGKKQKSDEETLWQYRNLQNQTVIAGETLYIALKSFEAQDAALARKIEQLGRTEKEMKLRCELGQVSQLSVDQVSAGRAQAVSGRETLNMNRETLLLQMESMVGAPLGEPLSLGALPKVTAQELAAMDLETDLERAKAASYALFDAKKQLDDYRKDVYDKAIEAYGNNPKFFEVAQAKHALQAYQYNYENTLLTYELNFRTLYAQTKDAAQVLDAKRAAVANEEKNYTVAALKYEQGNISANALADAKNTLAEAKAAVSDAERDLFSKYRSYTWAVNYGILNG